MSLGWITTLTFAGASLLVGLGGSAAYLALFHYRAQIRRRICDVNDKANDPLDALFVHRRQKRNQADPMSWSVRAREYYEQVRWGLAFETFVAATLSAALGAGAAVGAATRLWWTALLGFAAICSAATAFVVARHRRRRHILMTQLPKALDVVSRAVRAGQTVPAAFQIIADDFEAPIADEFRLCYEQQNLGIPTETALRRLALRSGLMELQILVVALLVQTRSGGSMVSLLENLSVTVHKRLRLQARVRALTGEGRMQAAVLIALPTVAFVLLFVVAREYVSTLLAYPGLLALSVGAQLLGALWIRRCIHFEY